MAEFNVVTNVGLAYSSAMTKHQPMVVGRIAKSEQRVTILYEISMLRFAYRQLQMKHIVPGHESWSWLELFLLHYRNLIEFLGRKKKSQGDDLHVLEFWQNEKLPEPSDVPGLHKAGIALFDDKVLGNRAISKRLAHCTDGRLSLKRWPVDEMYQSIEELILRIEPILKPYPPDLLPELTAEAALNPPRRT